MILKILVLILAVPAVCLIAGALYFLIRRPLVRFYRQRAAEPDYCTYDRVPAQFLHYLIQIEDDRFFTHHGIRFDTIRMAIRRNKRERKIVMGGSTITQQLVKNLYFNFEHNYLRKLIEAILTLYAECALKKEQILELYLNIIYFGNGKYGITDAVEFYFHKSVEELSVNQQFFLACVPYAPTTANPVKHPDVFLRVRDRRLRALSKRNVISDGELECIRRYDDKCLDPELRPCGEEESRFPDTIVMVNQRFGLAKKRQTAM